MKTLFSVGSARPLTKSTVAHWKSSKSRRGNEQRTLFDIGMSGFSQQMEESNMSKKFESAEPLTGWLLGGCLLYLLCPFIRLQYDARIVAASYSLNKKCLEFIIGKNSSKPTF